MKVTFNPLTEDDLIDLNFEKIKHFTITNSFIYKLGRNRHLSIGSVGTPNEMLYICESDPNDYRKIIDLVCLHNYDYDGYLSKSNLNNLIESIGKTKEE